MKLLFRIPAFAIAALLTVRANAGETYTAPQPPSEIFGSGWYGAIELGGNIYQDRGDVRNFTLGTSTLRIDPNNDTGFFGGIKIGYVFGQGTVRFALEEDMFYNGWQTGADSTLTLGGVTTTSSSNITVNTGAFMTNGLIKFGNGKFQPYIGFGIGAYYGESAGGNIGPFTNLSGGASHADFAWQAIAGADYYMNRTNSLFVEYKFLEYTAYPEWGDTRVLGQHLLGAGWRFHF